MKRALLLVVPATLAFTGCAGSISGEVDGKSVPGIGSAYFTEGLIGNRNVLSVTLTTMSNGCEGAKAYFDEALAAQDARSEAEEAATSVEELEATSQAYFEELARIERAHRPKEYWLGSILLTSDSVEELVGEELEPSDETPFGFTLTHIEDYAYPETVEPGETPDTQENVTGYTSSDLTLELDSYAHESSITGSGTAALKRIGGDGDDAGEVAFSFNATFCNFDD